MKLRLYFLAIILICTASIAFGDGLRFGTVISPQEHERKLGGNIEYILDNEYTFLHLKPHVGITISPVGHASVLYSGFVITRRYGESFMMELSLGFSAHNGKLRESDGKKGRTLGSSLLFRESIAFGYYYTNDKFASIFFDHISNANTVPPNHGITNVGLRLGIDL